MLFVSRQATLGAIMSPIIAVTMGNTWLHWPLCGIMDNMFYYVNEWIFYNVLWIMNVKYTLIKGIIFGFTRVIAGAFAWVKSQIYLPSEVESSRKVGGVNRRIMWFSNQVAYPFRSKSWKTKFLPGKLFPQGLISICNGYETIYVQKHRGGFFS